MAKVFYVTCPNCGKKVVHGTEGDMALPSEEVVLVSGGGERYRLVR